MKAYGVVDVHIHDFLTSALVGVEWSAHALTVLPPGKEARYPLDRRLSDPRTDLDNVEKRKFFTLLGLELRHLGRPARSQSPYRLRYPGPHRGKGIC
jgi:hypothetical protein